MVEETRMSGCRMRRFERRSIVREGVAEEEKGPMRLTVSPVRESVRCDGGWEKERTDLDRRIDPVIAEEHSTQTFDVLALD